MTVLLGGAVPYVSRAGARLFYEDLGAGEPPIVFVHGIGHHEHFAPQIEHFQRNRRVIAPDLAGFGRSELPAGRECRITEHAADIAWLCDELDVRAPIVVGHSMGGAIAFEIAAARPDVVSAIVLLDPIPIVPLRSLREQRAPLLSALAGPDYRDAFRGFVESRMFRPTDDPTIRARIVDDMCATPQHVLEPTFADLTDWTGERLAHQVHCPVLFITAGDGMPADMARTRELLPGMELGRTVGCGHFVHLFSPEQVDAMIDRFIAVSLSTNVDGVVKRNLDTAARRS